MRPIVIESTYEGLEIKLPIVKQTFHDLVNNFKLRKVYFKLNCLRVKVFFAIGKIFFFKWYRPFMPNTW
jgi:hypothetical protein